MFFCSPLPSEPRLISYFHPPAAFRVASTPAPSLFPSFDTAHCTWKAIFKLIIHPNLLWDCWGLWNLGAYPDVKSLWEAWDEGASVEGVGRAPSPRLIESEWGRHEDQRMGKGKLPAWRPCKNANVSVFSSRALPLSVFTHNWFSSMLHCSRLNNPGRSSWHSSSRLRTRSPTEGPLWRLSSISKTSMMDAPSRSCRSRCDRRVAGRGRRVGKQLPCCPLPPPPLLLLPPPAIDGHGRQPFSSSCRLALSDLSLVVRFYL
jgi:hypothetical protein